MEYEDFSIWITLTADGTYQVKADSPGGGTAKATLQLPKELDVDRVEELLTGLARSVRGDAQATETNGGSERELRDIAAGPSGEPTAASVSPEVVGLGVRLYQALFNGEVQELYLKSRVKGQGLRIRLNMDLEDEGLRELSRLPWEFLNRDQEGSDLGFLNLSEETPIVRDLEISQPRDPLPFDLPLRVLVVIANPPGSTPLNLEQEEETIAKTFSELRHAGQVEYDVIRQATKEKLFDQLDEKDYHVLHYMGHGDFSEGDGRGVLLMEGDGRDDQHVSSGTLALMLQDHADTVRLVFLNACKTAMSSSEGDLDPHGGVATSLIEAGIPAVVAMQFPISDRAAIGFSRTFYHRLVRGKPVDTAVAAARKYLRVMEPSTNEWATPVLFMRCRDGVLFDMGGSPPASDPVVMREGAVHVPEGAHPATPPASPATPAPPSTETESVTSGEPPGPPEPLVPAGVDLNADFAVWLAEEEGRIVLHWRARSAGSRDFVAVFPSRPTDPDGGYLPDFGYASDGESYRTSVPARPGYWAAYVAEDATGNKTIKAYWGPTT